MIPRNFLLLQKGLVFLVSWSGSHYAINTNFRWFSWCQTINSKSGNGGGDITYAPVYQSLFKMTARMERLALRQ